MEETDFAKQNDHDLAARPLSDIATKLLKQGFNVSPGLGCRRLHALVELLVRAQLLQGLRYFSISIGPSCSVIDVKKARSSNRWSL